MALFDTLKNFFFSNDETEQKQQVLPEGAESEFHMIQQARQLLPEIQNPHPVFTIQNFELYFRHREFELARWQLKGLGELAEDAGQSIPEEFWGLIKEDTTGISNIANPHTASAN